MAKDLFEDILKKALKASRRPLSTRKLALKTDMAWPTAKIKLAGLKKIGVVKSSKLGSKTLWRLPKVNPKMFEIPKPRKGKKFKLL